MTRLHRSIIAVCAATALAGAGLAMATSASATAPPASWKCDTRPYTKPAEYATYCLNVPSGRKYAVVVNCKIFATGKTSVFVGDFVRTGFSSVPKSACTNLDGYVTTYGARQG